MVTTPLANDATSEYCRSYVIAPPPATVEARHVNFGMRLLRTIADPTYAPFIGLANTGTVGIGRNSTETFLAEVIGTTQVRCKIEQAVPVPVHTATS